MFQDLPSKKVALATDPLFVGATRPAMRWGVTYSALLANLVLTMELFLLTRNLLALLVAVPIHLMCVALCATDARFFDLWMHWCRTRGPALFGNFSFWGASSYSPLPLGLPDAHGKRRSDTLTVRW
ncbi:MAG TPA: type IV secretion system protein VirB3 [Steroidobacteraceae bacterium]